MIYSAWHDTWFAGVSGVLPFPDCASICRVRFVTEQLGHRGWVGCRVPSWQSVDLHTFFAPSSIGSQISLVYTLACLLGLFSAFKRARSETIRFPPTAQPDPS